MSIVSAAEGKLLSRPQTTPPFDEIIAEVAAAVAPVWPLKDYVAVNPYAGISQRDFMDARAFLQVFSDCETLMPVEYYAAQFQQLRFTVADIESAISQISASGLRPSLSAPEIAEQLLAIRVDCADPVACEVIRNSERPIRTVAESATNQLGWDWSEAIVEEISKHCSNHYDQGQAIWSSPHQKSSLYEAWRTVAEHDRNIEILGLTGFRNYVAQLPDTPAAAITQCLQQLEVPRPLWSTFLLCQAFSVPGWSAWAKYQAAWNDGAEAQKDALTGLLAIRLAYDAALAKAKAIRLSWPQVTESESVSFESPWTMPGDDSILRYVLLRASEIGYGQQLLDSLLISRESAPTNDIADAQKLAQMVFCIDVRSERVRRQLESQSRNIETFGFAGFFAMAFEYLAAGEQSGTSHLPVLLKPQFRLREGLDEAVTGHETEAIKSRQQTRTWRKLWASFKSSAVGCFSFVETTGLLYVWKLLGQSFGYGVQSTSPRFDGFRGQDRSKLGPTLRGLNDEGIDASQQADMAEAMLRNLGLTKDFAKLVVFCGHSSQTENNPLAAGLDCGACGGHSGEPNARFAALLLNQPSIRESLAQRGIEIPSQTHFLGALHNTTTDEIEFFDLANIPTDLRASLEELIVSCAAASEQTRAERLPVLGSNSASNLLKRAGDWSEVRPEWGLAGNAAFIAAPRSVTKGANLDAHAFLHSYDYTRDAEGNVLETIMTAPMVVAHWINMQYYASTVDNRHFGSGDKTVHNVVGKFGILSGNGGDLMTGLPWQSLHTGDQYQHLPMRLQVVIAAPRTMIDRVVDKHELVANLLTGGWLHLIAIENETMYRFSEQGMWESLERSRV